ncbi:hypothetical protein EVAR_84414_1 [Eumeta japonica]|uniref:Uncharacterized protein n=1 Tax=Eumeta variegata TaxID=151549 RepID=A0A4C1W1I2_EUMVA|nr:hypothetical protein EVAR_84414_1 [Eumeta japonica]
MHWVEFPEAIKSIVANHYVDDSLQNFENIEKVARIANEIQNIHRKANFHVKKWTLNSKEVIAALNPSTKYTQEVKINDGDHGEKVLGLTWQPSDDTLSFNLNFINKNYQKRSAHSCDVLLRSIGTGVAHHHPV